jgi:pyruvate dehydrogenase E2 component (dihydrolipoamide acetyltransferase)
VRVAQVKQFKLPDVGEGLTEAEIVSWKVRPGQAVAVNDVVVEIETAKSLVELPCPFSGVVSELLAEEGSTVPVGTPIISVDVGASGPLVEPAEPTEPAESAASAESDHGDHGLRENLVPSVPRPAEEGAVEPGLIGGPAPGGRTSVLVGYGPRTTSAVRRPRKSAPTAPAPAAQAPGVPEVEPARARVLAKPPVRKLAKTLGVDLGTVAASGPAGTVTREDVEAAARDGAQAVTARPDEGARERRYPIKGVRKATASAMVASAFTAPHVTEFVTVDVTRSMKLLERLRRDRDFEGMRLGPLLLLMRSVLLAVRRHPEINSSWDEAAGEIVVKDYVNLGIATAAPRGLLVPNIKDADRMALPELARALADLVATAREGRTQPDAMSGGTFTITNVGMFGVDTGTPILNPGEAAILCFGAVREMPWVHKGAVRPRQVTQLGMSFDHRIVDGELGSKFLADVARLLEHPSLALAWA